MLDSTVDIITTTHLESGCPHHAHVHKTAAVLLWMVMLASYWSQFWCRELGRQAISITTYLYVYFLSNLYVFFFSQGFTGGAASSLWHCAGIIVAVGTQIAMSISNQALQAWHWAWCSWFLAVIMYVIRIRFPYSYSDFLLNIWLSMTLDVFESLQIIGCCAIWLAIKKG